MARRVSSPVFVGREEELEALRAALGSAAAGRAQGLLLAGDSGVGKTRLLREFRESTGASRTQWLSGECISLAGAELPFAPITAALRSMIEELRELDVPTVAPELARLIPEIGHHEAPDRYPAAGDRPPPLMGGELAQGRLFAQFLSLLADLSSEGPVVLAVEDLHWADRSTRDLLSYLIRSAGDKALLLICTYRSDELHRQHPLRPFLAEHRRLEWVEGLELRPFTESELGAQLEGILGAPPDPAFAARLFERSEGNPFFTEELLAASADGERLPQTIRDALVLRFDALSPRTQEVARVAAASGRRVPHALLAAVAGLPEPQLTEALREATAHQILVQDVDARSYRFRHALLAEAVYADLLPGERTRLHLALAEALAGDPGLAAEPTGNTAAELAFHWRACNRLDDALAASVDAGAKAERSYAFAAANLHFENALELWDQVEDAESRTGMDRAAVLLRAAENASQSGQTPRAVALARAAVADIDAQEEPVRGALGRERLGEYLWLSGDSEAALDALSEAVDLLPVKPPSAERARVLSAEGRILMVHGRPKESRTLCEEAIAIAHQIGDRAEEGRALNTLGCNLLFLGDRERAISLLREAMRIAKDCSPGDLWRTYGNLAEALEQDGRIEEGVRVGIEGAEVSRGLGQRSWRGWILGEVALRLSRLGRLDEAERFAAMGLETLQEGIDAAMLYSAAAEVDLLRGNLEQARRKLERAAEAAGPTGDPDVLAMLTDRLARLALLRGDPDRAAALVEEALAKMDAGEYVFYTARMYAVAVRAHADRAERARALGDARIAADAERLGTALVERLERLLEPDRWLDSPPPESVARASLAAAEVARLRGAPDPATWSAVASQWMELGFPLELAYARWRQAEAVLAAGGTKAEASEPLQEAARLSAEAGASALGAEIEALARRARIELGGGAEAASTEPPGPEADRFGLTDRELDVLALVAEGRTNREIGDALFISTKTASAHVSHILSKLDVRSRIEAATAAHRLGLVAPSITSKPGSKTSGGPPADPSP